MLFLKIVFSHLPFTAFALAFRVEGVPHASFDLYEVSSRKCAFQEYHETYSTLNFYSSALMLKGIPTA